MRSWILAGVALAMASPAWAEEKPRIGAPEAWVDVIQELPKPMASAAGAPVAALLQDFQQRFDARGQSVFTAYAVKAQTSTGVQALGTLTFRWAPATDVLTVHHLRLRRDGRIIDLLPKDGVFTILRQEQRLNSAATMDGVLTAVVEPADVRVGDILDVAYTVRREDPLLKGRVDTVSAPPSETPLSRYRVKTAWPASAAVQWKTAGGLPDPTVRTVDGLTEAQIDLADHTPKPSPRDAPLRYRLGPYLVLSGYASWAEVSASMAPLYAEAARLKADSPLKAEARDIAARFPTPAARAEAVLKLVQENVRYLAQTMGEGGLKPMAADETWTLRYGDCKAKTALILALLYELGLNAEPALVSTTLGDGLDARLPSLTFFDHVMVRLNLEGRDYWMDGARVGDSVLADLPIPDTHFALPVRAGGATLVPLVQQPLSRPEVSISLRFDASKGLSLPAPAHAERVIRGDDAVTMNAELSQLAPDALDHGLREYWRKRYDFVTVTSVSARFDPVKREQTLVMDGTAVLDWSDGYEPQTAVIGWKADASRAPGTDAEAPFATAFPNYVTTEETVLLPNKGKGFTVAGEAIDKALFGYAFTRQFTLKDGAFRITTSQRSLVPEISAAQARADAPALTALGKQSVRVRANGVPPTAEELRALKESNPTTADALVARARANANAGKMDEVEKDLDASAKLEGISPDSLSQRVLLYVEIGQLSKAKRDFKLAERAGINEAQKAGLLISIATKEENLQAVTDQFTKLIAQWPTAEAYQGRAEAYILRKDYPRALADLDQAIKLSPERQSDFRERKVAVYLLMKQPEKARTEALLIPAAADDPETVERRVRALRTAGDKPGARAEVERGLAAKPSPALYLHRAGLREMTDMAGKTADAEAAHALAPEAIEPVQGLINIKAFQENYPEALAWVEKWIALEPEAGEPLAARGFIRASAGDRTGGAQDFAKASKRLAGSAMELNNLCYQRAKLDLELDAALADCKASLALNPGNAATLDSLGFVLLRQGKDREALQAYEKALAADKALGVALYGKSLAQRRLGMTAAADRSREAALATDKNVEKTFEKYGVTR